MDPASTLQPEVALETREIEVRIAAPGQQPQTIVGGIHLQVRRQRITGLVGESGSGKSQLLHALFGLTRGFPGVTAGCAWLQPVPGQVIPLVEASPPGSRPRFVADYRVLSQHVSVMFQGVDSHLNPYESVSRQLLRKAALLPKTAVAGAGGPQDFVHARLTPLFAAPGERTRIARSFPCELSGGQRIRVGLCLALTSPAWLLIADEPTTGLDPGLRREIFFILRDEVENRQRTLLIISHDVGLVGKFAEDLHVMRQGRIVESVVGGGAPSLQDPYSRMLFSSLDDIAQMSFPRACSDSVTGAHPAARSLELQPELILQANGLSKTFQVAGATNNCGDRVVHAVQNASFSIRRGEAVGLVGESGSGKSTLARMLAGLIPPDSGQVLFQSASEHRAVQPGERGYRQHVQMLHQNPDTMLHPRVDVGGLCRDSMTLWRERCKYIDMKDFLDFAQLAPERAHQYCDSLSGGEKRRFGLARVLAGQPELVLADEIASGLDRVLQARILARLGRLRSSGLTLVIITHDLDLARYLCDTVLVMKNGQIVDRCRAAELCPHARHHHPYTEYLLRAESLEPEPGAVLAGAKGEPEPPGPVISPP